MPVCVTQELIDCFAWNIVVPCWSCFNLDIANVSGADTAAALATRKRKNDKLRTDGRTLTFIMRRESESASLLTQNTAEWVYRQGQKYDVFASPLRRRSVRVSVRVDLIRKWRNKQNFCLDFCAHSYVILCIFLRDFVHILTWFCAYFYVILCIFLGDFVRIITWFCAYS
jgi:hypothetical protein